VKFQTPCLLTGRAKAFSDQEKVVVSCFSNVCIRIIHHCHPFKFLVASHLALGAQGTVNETPCFLDVPSTTTLGRSLKWLQIQRLIPGRYPPIPSNSNSIQFYPIRSNSYWKRIIPIYSHSLRIFQKAGPCFVIFSPPPAPGRHGAAPMRTVLSTWRPELRRPGDSSTLSALGCQSGVALVQQTEKLIERNGGINHDQPRWNHQHLIGLLKMEDILLENYEW